ncbi:hypothetical protein HYALB_00012699 [Hymenoscyphus albidus]|uniref:Uncharacterized protein n=1 Tax=Hymenoscyphus albidus TaxID=595503 RepID=A0A9N9LT11_9HELO|nr:hypothetical protein HYALB_00012699 [Hymenoscyphus albidus]
MSASGSGSGSGGGGGGNGDTESLKSKLKRYKETLSIYETPGKYKHGDETCWCLCQYKVEEGNTYDGTLGYIKVNGVRIKHEECHGTGFYKNKLDCTWRHNVKPPGKQDSSKDGSSKDGSSKHGSSSR